MPAARKCRRVGRLIEKGGCFALHGEEADIWLEMDPVPLHLLDEVVEITGRQYGRDLIWVQAIGPARRFS